MKTLIATIATIATAAALAISAPAQAATIHEGSLAGGSFSGSWSAPTALGTGVTEATGTGSQHAFDFFTFTLPAGAQTLTFDFWAPPGIGYSYSAGGTIKTSTTPFKWGWDGATAGIFQLNHGKTTDKVTLTLGPAFAGTLNVGLYFTHGANISYRVSSDAAVPAPGVVPLPATGLLLLTALGGGAVAACRRRA
jgi:hypothetical protein